MKLLFKQRFFSWLDSYDVFSEDGSKVFAVQGRLSLGHCLEIENAFGEQVGMVKEELLTLLPRFALYSDGRCIGEIRKRLTFLRDRFDIDCNGWRVDGNLWDWDYQIVDATGQPVATIQKQLLNFTDTYVIEVCNPPDALLSLMVVLAIDAVKCSSGNG